MAINQEPLSRTITLPAQTVSAGTGLTQLASATSQISKLVTERINDVAIQQAALQGERDVQEGNAPENLTLPFTKATKAYNDAVSSTEARRMISSAEELIKQALVEHKNPATFTRESPGRFAASLEGIKSGILQHTRDENREKIREALDHMTAQASLNMLQHSIAFDNQQTQANLKQDVTRLLEARRNAAISGDMERLAGIDAALEESIADYSAMNQEIARAAPYFRSDIEKHKEIDNVLAGYSHALAQGDTARYLADLSTNKQNLPFDVWQDAVKGVVALDQTQKRLNNDINAEQWAAVQLAINNGSVQSASDLLNYDLTVTQQLTAMRQLDTAQAKQMKENSEIITAQQNILNDRPQFNSPSTRNKMFQSAIQSFEQRTGQIATLQDMEQSILGLNEFPASGMPETALGANVPEFDSLLQGKLTSGDIMATAQAAMVYNDMVNVKQKPNSVNLSGDALSVATLFNTLNKGGTTPEQAAELAINSVLNASEPQIAARIDQFHKTLEKVNPKTGKNGLQIQFKDAFDLDPQAFGSGEAFKVFSDLYRAHYLASNSEQAALDATKYEMRQWGTSPHFDKGYVGNPVPENELPITKIGYAFDNQIIWNLQGFIDRNNAAREANPELKIPLIEWADTKQEITGDISEQDKVFKKFTIGSKPRLKINGQETDVVLIPSATSRLSGRISFLLGVYDQFNILHPLRDVTNTSDQVARFMPQELSTWTPGIASKKVDEDLRRYAIQANQKELQLKTNELKELEKKTPEWQLILGLARSDEYLQYVANRDEASSEGRLNAIIEGLRQRVNPTSSEQTRDAITNADNVGVSQDLGLVIPGNIDLTTRPRVKNADGKISTVRTIGVESDGLEFVIPTVSDDGKLLSDKEAIALFKRTKKHLGAFKTKEEAKLFAERLHESEAAKLAEEGLQ